MAFVALIVCVCNSLSRSCRVVTCSDQAPEVLKKQPYGVKADVFSFGALRTLPRDLTEAHVLLSYY